MSLSPGSLCSRPQLFPSTQNAARAQTAAANRRALIPAAASGYLYWSCFEPSVGLPGAALRLTPAATARAGRPRRPGSGSPARRRPAQPASPVLFVVLDPV